MCIQGYERLCGDTSRFASLTSEKLLCCVDEGELPEDAPTQKKVVAALKSKVTEPFGILERKFFEAMQILCCLRIIVLTNQFAPVLFGRRFALYQLDDTFANNPEYFGPFSKALTPENGCLFLSYLSGFDLSAWNRSKLPDTAYSRQLQHATAAPLLRFFSFWVPFVEDFSGGETIISAKALHGLYSQWACEEGERAQGSVARLSNIVVHYGLAVFVDECVRDDLRFSKTDFLLRMGQLLPRKQAFSKSNGSQWVPSAFLRPGRSLPSPPLPTKSMRRPMHRPRPAPCGRPIPRPVDVLIARQGSDSKCALWALQGAVQEVIDFEPFLDEGAAAASVDDASGSGVRHHGEGGNWSITAIARALSLHGRYVSKHIGDKRGLAAFEPDHSNRPVLGIVVHANRHYTARIARPDHRVLKLDSLRPDACVELQGAEIEIDQEMHPCAYRVEEGQEDMSDDVLQSIKDLERVPMEAPPGLWDLDTSDPAAPRLKWVPATELDATVYAWMRCDKARPGDAADDEVDVDADDRLDPDVVEDFPTGSGSAVPKSPLRQDAPACKDSAGVAAEQQAPPVKRPRVGGKTGDWASNDPALVNVWLAWYRGPRAAQGQTKSAREGCTVSSLDCTEKQPCTKCTDRYKKHKWRRSND